MNTSNEQLRLAIEAETSLFCQAEQAIQEQKGRLGHSYSDERLHARMANCGIATAFIQETLLTHHAVNTERLYGEPPLAPRLPHGNRHFGHVVLRHEGLLIDPTYGQLFSFIGVNPRQAETSNRHYPKPLALLIDTTEPESEVNPLTEAMHRAATLDHAQHSSYAPLRDIGRQAIQAALHDIYTQEHYTPFEVSPLDPSYDHVQELLKQADKLR